MVHSIELLVDADTEAAIHRAWDALSDAGLRTPPPTSRPHVTLLVADEISPDVDAPLSQVLQRLPLACVIGAPIVFGRSPFVLVRLVVPSTELLELHADAARICSPYLTPTAAPNTGVGQWTPHTTLARRVEPSQLVRALCIRTITRDIRGNVVGMRRWDGLKRVEHLIG
ncbi:2'-5' RNA ligase family protein [Mycobacterium sp.]|uniref:2'-5' RNA ligase family protein n=1 Tax=Mycobacterium sp. TaxID=1785 RepID=UPI003C714F18